MTAPYSSSLLNETVNTDDTSIPRPFADSARSVMTADEALADAEDAGRSATATMEAPKTAARRSYQPAPTAYRPQPRPMYPAPMPQQVLVAPAAPRNHTATMALLTVLLAVIAGIAAYAATVANSPSTDVAARVKTLAATEAFKNGAQQGTNIGRDWGYAQQQSVTAQRANLAGSRAYDQGYAAGVKAGAASYRPTTYRGGYGYGGRSYGFGGSGAISQAFNTAQNWADITNAPVDVEIY